MSRTSPSRKEGQLLATDAAHAYVQAFDKTSGKFISRFGGKGEKDEHLDKPEGIAVDPEGNIFIADYNTGFIKKYDTSYKWLLTFSEYGSEKGQNIKSEFMDIRDGKLYMPEAGNHRVDVFDLNGKFLFDFGGLGTEPGKMNNPESAKFNSDGKLYVADLKNDRIQVFDKDGKFLKLWGKTGSANGEFKAPAGIAIDAQDRVYVTEIGNDRVQVFDKDGKFLTILRQQGSRQRRVRQPARHCRRQGHWLDLRRRHRQQPHPGVQAREGSQHLIHRSACPGNSARASTLVFTKMLGIRRCS